MSRPLRPFGTPPLVGEDIVYFELNQSSPTRREHVLDSIQDARRTEGSNTSNVTKVNFQRSKYLLIVLFSWISLSDVVLAQHPILSNATTDQAGTELTASQVRWGSSVHRLVNRSATFHLPADFAFFIQWTDDLERLSTAADERKSTDPAEFNRHFFDVDDYPEFFTGDLPRTYDDFVVTYGQERVDRNGIVPWAIESNFAELVTHFSAGEWEEAIAVAADLGHYVADVHSPMHLTVNFDGQLTGQDGVHARHETHMTNRHLADLEPAPDSIYVIDDLLDTVFEWIDRQYAGVDSVLTADSLATLAAGGSTQSEAYYDALWNEVGEETIVWVRDASIALASMWYAAWKEAGSPVITSTDRETPVTTTIRILPNTPNPFRESTDLLFEIGRAGNVELSIYDISGRLIRRWTLNASSPGIHSVRWDGTNDAGESVASGVYHLIALNADGILAQGQLVRLK